jgi:dihydroxyacetone kinase-like predicted kinase
VTKPEEGLVAAIMRDMTNAVEAAWKRNDKQCVAFMEAALSSARALGMTYVKEGRRHG